MTLAKVKEQDGMTLAKVRHAQVSHALHWSAKYHSYISGLTWSRALPELVERFEGFARASCTFRGLCLTLTSWKFLGDSPDANCTSSKGFLCPSLVLLLSRSLALSWDSCKPSMIPNDAQTRICYIMTSRDLAMWISKGTRLNLPEVRHAKSEPRPTLKCQVSYISGLS